MTSLGVRRLYFDDDKGDLHVFDGKDAFWRWYGAPNQYRDPLQTPRVWSYLTCGRLDLKAVTTT